MLTCITEITIQQNATENFPNRKQVLYFNFVNEWESEDNWKNLTNTAKVTLPKNIYYTDQNNKLQSIINIGGFSDNNPFFLKGDSINIVSGYSYFDKNGNPITDKSTVFTGYITKVSSKKPFTLDCEDNMWLLKQLPAPNKLFKAKEYTIEKILKELLKETQFTVNVLTDTSVGDFRTQGETAAQVLARLRKDFHFEPYFRGNELRCGTLVYIEQDAIDAEKLQKKVFRFQHNIIEDNLEYVRKDDVVLSAIGYSVNKKELTEKTKDGKTKTKQERLEVLVYSKKGDLIGQEKQKDKDFPQAVEGERKTFYFWNVSNAKELINLTKDKLKLYYTTGFKGSFTTFGIPYVRQGDNIYIINTVLPEQSGYYKVKAVKYSGGVGGIRQEITPDYLIRQLTDTEVKRFSK